jgi:hypothetical protein
VTILAGHAAGLPLALPKSAKKVRYPFLSSVFSPALEIKATFRAQRKKSDGEQIK